MTDSSPPPRQPLLYAASFLVALLATPPADGLEPSAAEQKRLELRAPAGPDAGAPLRLQPPADGQRKFALVIIRGLTKNESLAPGIRSGDAWYVSAKDLGALRILPAGDAARLLPITASFIGSDASAPVVRNFTVHIEPQAGRAEASAPPSSESEQRSLREAAQLMKNGDVAAARLLFEDLALQGSARGAFAMGQSYDPDVLARMPIHGLSADPENARRWYEKARRLVSRENANAPKISNGVSR